MFAKTLIIVLGLAGWIFCAQASAEPAAAPASRPAPAAGTALPIKIEADRAELTERGGASIYSGKVRVRQGELEMQGDRLQLERAQSGEITAKLTGTPAKAQQPAKSGGLVTASAQQIDYSSSDKTMVLQGGAEIVRGKDRITSENIRYNTETQRIVANGQGKPGDRVQITIQPDKPAQTGP